MLAPVLVAYSTRTGSTREVAEAVANDLRLTRLQVDIARMRDVKTIDQYSTVILGTPIYVGKLPNEVHQFMGRFLIPLSRRLSWVFVLGPVLGSPDEFGLAAVHAGKELFKFPLFQPVEVKILGGRFDAARLPLPFNLVRILVPSQFKGVPSADLRDWDDIHAWATTVSWRIKPIASQPVEPQFAPEPVHPQFSPEETLIG
jgi:menaquinone-dependent protoporphyrinogen oxidase